MPGQDPSQKKIAESYRGNLGYFLTRHPLRRWRLWIFVLTAAGAVFAMAGYHFLGRQEAYSPGPIASNHAHFASDCQACHIPPDKRGTSGALLPPQLAHAPLAQLDAACLRCHPTKQLHLPLAGNLALHTVADTPVVHGAGCAVCHKEHVGRTPIAPPNRQSCLSCHNSKEELERTRRLLFQPEPEMRVLPPGGTAELGDGVLRYIAPQRPSPLPPFDSYAGAHPDFAYQQEGLKDSTKLKFNHYFHLTDSRVRLPGAAPHCTACHEPAVDGALMRPVRYDQHCKTSGCHELALSVTFPDLTDVRLPIPHRDADKVGAVLGSLEAVGLPRLLRQRGKTDVIEIATKVQEALKALGEKGLRYPAQLEDQVFFGKNNVKHGSCVECHEVTRIPDAVPRVTPPRQPERWVQRGPFTHLPHRHMQCLDCHAAAEKSHKTEDILLPPKQLCVECHRPAEIGATVSTGKDPALASTQRSVGGVRADCQGCHPFHAPPGAEARLSQ